MEEKAKGNHNWWRKKSFDMGKENIHGAVTLYQYASYIGQIYMSELLGTITFFLHPQPNCHKRFITDLTKSIAVSLSLSLDLTYLYILSCEDGKIVFASGKRKILQNVHPTENKKKRYHQQFFQSVCRQIPQNMYVVHWPYFSSVEVLNISREKHQKYNCLTWLDIMKTFDIIDNFKLRKCILGRDHPWPSQWKCKEEFNRRGAEASNSSTLQNQHKLASIVTIGLEFSFEIRGNGGDQLERESSHITNIQSGGRGGWCFNLE